MTTLMQMPDGRLIRKFVVLFVCFLVNDDDGDFLSFFLSLSLCMCVCVCLCVCVIRAMNRTFVAMSIIIIIWIYGCMDDGDDDRAS